jgi:hypothetical protein
MALTFDRGIHVCGRDSFVLRRLKSWQTGFVRRRLRAGISGRAEAAGTEYDDKGMGGG